jgi:hypothetical protein
MFGLRSRTGLLRVTRFTCDLAVTRPSRKPSALAPGGRAAVLAPEGQNICGRLDEVLGHFRRYSREQLSSRIEEAGLEVETILDFNRISRPAWFVSGRILRREAISRMQLRIFDRLVWLWSRIDGMIPWKPTSIIAIARKPEA